MRPPPEGLKRKLAVNAPRAASAAPWPERVAAVDLARGYLMFVQISYPVTIAGILPLVSSPRVRDFLAEHFDHAAWHGLNYVDLGLPGYTLMMGMALHLAMGRARLAGTTGRQLLAPIATRTAVLFALGLICNGGFTELWPEVRIVGVLQRLSICYAVGCAVAWYLSWRLQSALVGALLGGYWALLEYVPFPGAPADRYAGLANLVVYVDQTYLPGLALYGNWDPEGILTTIPAIATCLAGVVLGHLFTASLEPKPQLLGLLAVGIGGMALAKAWAPWLPINKYMWTSSFVLAAIGAVVVHLLALHLIWEVWGRRKLLAPLLVYGRNSLTAYVGDQLLDFETIGLTIAGGSVAVFFGHWSGLALAVTVIAIEWSLLSWLDKRRTKNELTGQPRASLREERAIQTAA